jgi:hypothetical protein
MSRYAKNTSVPVSKSKNEIEQILLRYGADQFLYGVDLGGRRIIKKYEKRQIKMRLPLPNREEFRYTESRGLERHPDDIEKSWEKACRQRWRALCLVIKAKLEAIESGIASFEDEFLAYTMLPSGDTVGEWAVDKIDKAIESGQMPKLLPART